MAGGNKIYWFYKEKDLWIGADLWQWVIKRRKNYTYHPTLEWLLYALSEAEIRDAMGAGEKEVLSAMDTVKRNISKLVRGIQLPRKV